MSNHQQVEIKDGNKPANGKQASSRGQEKKGAAATGAKAPKGGSPAGKERTSSGYRGSGESAAKPKGRARNTESRKVKSNEDEDSDELVPLTAQEGLEVAEGGQASQSQEASVTKEIQRIKENHHKKLSKEQRDIIQNITKLDGIQSIYSLVEKHPGKFKEVVDRLAEDHEELNESRQRTKKEVAQYEQKVD